MDEADPRVELSIAGKPLLQAGDFVAWTRRWAQYAYVCLLLREADIARASEFEHAVQRIDGDGHFGCAAPVRA